MARTSGSYDSGKDGESKTWDYLRSQGYVRPTAKQRKNIVAALVSHGINVNARGFDAFHADLLPLVDTVDALRDCLDRIQLFEVKTCGANRKAEVSPGFRGLGFTLTRKEVDNAILLKSQYRFVFVNLRTQQHRECALEDFFNVRHSRVYETWSVFLTRDLPEAFSTEDPPQGDQAHSHRDKGSGVQPHTFGIFLHLCCEGWVSAGPFERLSFLEDMTKVVDESGRVVAERHVGRNGWLCPSLPNMIFEDLVVSPTSKHPPY